MTEKDINTNELENVDDTQEKESSYNQEALESLLDFDFSSDEEFDLESSYNFVNEFEEAQAKQKISQEEKLIAKIGPEYIQQDFFEKLDNLKNNIRSYFKKYDANSDYIQGLVKDYKKNKDTIDKIFTVCKFLLRTYEETINNLFFVFHLSKKEYNMIMDTVVKSSQVTGNEVLLEGLDTLLGYLQEWRSIYSKTPGGQDVVMELPISISSTVLMYHFLSKKTVKGFGDPFYTLRGIMFKLKETNDLHQAYLAIQKRYNEAFQLWVTAVTPLGEDINEEEKPQEILNDVTSSEPLSRK